MLAAAATLARQQRRGNRLSRGHRRGLVGDDGAHHTWLASAMVGLDLGQSRKRLNDRIVHALLSIGSVLTKARDRDVDDVRAYLAHHIFAEAHALDGTRPKVLHQHVGGGDELLEYSKTIFGFDVDRERALGAVARQERRGHAAVVDADAAHQLACWRLDLDHVGALVGQHHGRDWP